MTLIIIYLSPHLSVAEYDKANLTWGAEVHVPFSAMREVLFAVLESPGTRHPSFICCVFVFR